MYFTTGLSGITTCRFLARGTWITLGCFRTGCLVAGGDPAVEEKEDIEEENDPEGFSGLGAIGMADSTVLLYAGYPSHCRPERTHFRPSAVSRNISSRIA
ncbi:MAG: hypothetical protein CL912_12230 [Deltaproteobacteria bacterium]|nr:hypothetical protein [Deltaproteobacteria bacterium]